MIACAALPHLHFHLVFIEQHLRWNQVTLQLLSIENELLHALLHSCRIINEYSQFLSAKDASHVELFPRGRNAEIDSQAAILRLASENVLGGRIKRPGRGTAQPGNARGAEARAVFAVRSEEHTSELQSLRHLVCRLLLEKK